MLMLLTTADLLMMISHFHSFFELLCLLCFHFGDGGLKAVRKKRKKKVKINKSFLLKSFLWFEILRNSCVMLLTIDCVWWLLQWMCKWKFWNVQLPRNKVFHLFLPSSEVRSKETTKIKFYVIDEAWNFYDLLAQCVITFERNFRFYVLVIERY